MRKELLPKWTVHATGDWRSILESFRDPATHQPCEKEFYDQALNSRMNLDDEDPDAGVCCSFDVKTCEDLVRLLRALSEKRERCSRLDIDIWASTKTEGFAVELGLCGHHTMSGTEDKRMGSINVDTKVLDQRAVNAARKAAEILAEFAED